MAKKVFITGLLLVGGFVFCAGRVEAGWQAGPLAGKAKWREEGYFTRAAWSFTYRSSDFRWQWSLVYHDPSSDDRLSYLGTLLRRRAGGAWWYGMGGRLSTQPACDYRELRFLVENTGRRSWSGRVWGEGEQRVTHPSSKLDEYFYQEVGARIRWRREGFLWLGELKRRRKDYRTTRNSWRKYHLETGGDSRSGGHFFSLRYRESTGEYPENAWKNEWSNTWVARWEWTVTGDTRLVTRGARLFREWGENKRREEWELTGILEYPRRPETTVSWMAGYRKAIRRDFYPGEEEEEREDPGFRCGVRWRGDSSGRRVRVELFHAWKEEETTAGALLIIQGEGKRIRWRLGLAPRGGFNPSEEKGYWVEMRYYF